MKDSPPRARKVVRFDPGKWLADWPDDATWAELKQHIRPPLSDVESGRVLVAIRECMNQLAGERSVTQVGGELAAHASDHKKMAKHLKAALKIWRDLGGPVSGVPQHLDSLPLLTQEAERTAAMPIAKGPPVADAWKHFTQGVDKSLRDVGRNPGTTGRVYDESDNGPSWFQRFMLRLNKALPLMLREPAANAKAFHVATSRALRKPGDKSS